MTDARDTPIPHESHRDSIVPEWSRPVLLGGLGSLAAFILFAAVAWGAFGAQVDGQAAELEKVTHSVARLAEKSETRHQTAMSAVRSLELNQATTDTRLEAAITQFESAAMRLERAIERLDDRRRP